MQKSESAKSAKETVMELIHAMERKDWKTVRGHITDDISVVAPGPVEFTIFRQAEPYLKYLEHANVPPLDIKKEFTDGNDVCLFYEVAYGKPPVRIFVCGCFHANGDGKISSIRLVADPRPLFQQK